MEGKLQREVELKEPNGLLELSVAEAAARAETLPMRVSRALAVALAHVGGCNPSVELTAALCVADRQFLMHQLAAVLDLGRRWITVECLTCGQRFDFELDCEALPVGNAGPNYPFARVETSSGVLQFRVPTGADQADIADIADQSQAIRALAARLLIDGDAGALGRWTAGDMARIEAALDEVSPCVVTRVQAQCPACDHIHEVEVDPYFVLRAPLSRTLEDVHLIASAYHWSERDILSLPRARRAFYLARLDRARGMAS